MSTNIDNEVQRSLGNLEGTLNEGFKAINNRLDKINGSVQSHSKKIDDLETFRDNFQGRMSIIGSVAGAIGAIITMIINHFINKP